jgi:hypothetical protein
VLCNDSKNDQSKIEESSVTQQGTRAKQSKREHWIRNMKKDEDGEELREKWKRGDGGFLLSRFQGWLD